MLVLSRKRDEEVWIDVGGTIVKVVLIDIRGDKVRLGFSGPENVHIHRREVFEEIEREKLEGKRSDNRRIQPD